MELLYIHSHCNNVTSYKCLLAYACEGQSGLNVHKIGMTVPLIFGYFLISMVFSVTNSTNACEVNLDLMFIRLAGPLQSLVLNDKQLLQSSDYIDALRPYNG